MWKIITLSIQAIAFALFLAYIQGMLHKGPGEITKVIDSITKSNGTQIGGSEGSLQSVATKLMPLLAGKTGLADPPTDGDDSDEKALPTGPSTLIRYPSSAGHAAEPAVSKLPPGAKVIVIDGHLQVFYPGPKPNAAPPVQHRGCKKTTSEAECPPTNDATIQKYLDRLTNGKF